MIWLYDMNITGAFIPESSFGDRFAILGFDMKDNLSFYFNYFS